jgi:hypothetical protein
VVEPEEAVVEAVSLGAVEPAEAVVEAVSLGVVEPAEAVVEADAFCVVEPPEAVVVESVEPAVVTSGANVDVAASDPVGAVCVPSVPAGSVLVELLCVVDPEAAVDAVSVESDVAVEAVLPCSSSCPFESNGSIPSENGMQSGHVSSPKHSAKLALSPLQPSITMIESRPSTAVARQYLLRRILTASPCQPP